MKSQSLYLYLFVCFVVVANGLLGLSCNPKPASTPGVTPAQPPGVTPAQPPGALAQPPSQEEAAWAQVLAAAKREGRVTLYTWQFTGDIGQSVAKAFEEKYGIKLEFVTGLASQLTERVKSEAAGGKYIADTLDSSVALMSAAKGLGLTVSWGDLPVLHEKELFNFMPLVDPEKHIIGIAGATNFAWVNTNEVKSGQEPTSYRDLLAPSWKGKVSFQSPVNSPSMILPYLVMKKADLLDDEYWRHLGQNGLKVGPSVREPLVWLSRGEVSVLPAYPDAGINTLIKEGAPVKPLELKEGVLVFPALVSMTPIKNAPHPNAARVFLNWLLSKEGQTVYSQVVGGLPLLRKDVPDFRPALLQVTPKRPHIVDLPLQLEAAKVMQDGSVARLLGLEVK